MKKEEERNIYAVFDDKTIRVYQAYNNKIADEALKLGRFGSKFSLTRMTWIKPSFLWMMYRSGWTSKQGQERILAIDLKREGFDEIVKNAVLSSFRGVSGLSKEEWKEKLENSEVRCQWDPDRDIYGNPIGRRAIQLGIKGEFKTGSYGTMELEGMPPMEYKLTLVKPVEEFWDKTETPFGDILFGHQIIDNNDGSVNIKHTVILDSEDEKHLEFLSQVFSDVPQSIFILKNCLER